MREQSKQWIYADPSLSVVLQKARVKQGKRNISMIRPLLGQPLQTFERSIYLAADSAERTIK